MTAKPADLPIEGNAGFACAGGDKSLSIWITSNPRPIVVAQELAAKSISDLAWSPDGKCLYATALDGTILAVRFEDGDLGYAMEMENRILLEDILYQISSVVGCRLRL